MIRNILFLPHGMQIIPGVEDDQSQGFVSLDEAMHDLHKNLRNTNLSPASEVVFLTPHGYNLETSLVIYNHNKFRGHLYQLTEESNVIGEFMEELELKGSAELTTKIVTEAEKINLDYHVLVQGFPDYPLLLNWGEVVPLYYYSQYFPDSSYSIICYPRVRHEDLDQIISINEKLVDLLINLDKAITLVVSGDLSHTHLEDGPYGFHKSSTEFDKVVQEWAKTGVDLLMEELLRLQPHALACGMSGLNLIHQLRQMENYVLMHNFYDVPTYFGMAGYWWNSE